MDKESANLPEEEITRRRSEIWTHVKQLRPSTSAALTATIHEAGKIETQPSWVAEGLRKHGPEVFKCNDIDRDKHRSWMEEPGRAGYENPLDGNEGSRRTTKKDVDWALKHARSIIPGPDGVSSFMCRKL